jgi:hypothetical protein
VVHAWSDATEGVVDWEERRGEESGREGGRESDGREVDQVRSREMRLFHFVCRDCQCNPVEHQLEYVHYGGVWCVERGDT